MTAPGAILFDLDDTIIEFHALAQPAWDATLEALAGELGGHSPASVAEAIARISSRWWSDPERHRQGRLDLAGTRRVNVSQALQELGLAGDGLVERIVDQFERRRFETLRLFPGARETLEHFRAAGVPMALVTNGDGPGQRAKIERFGLAPYFRAIVIEGEFGAGKPEERVFRHALDQLGAAAAETWMVGDRLEWEIAPAQRLGMYAVWVDVAGQGVREGQDIQPDRVVRAIRELIGGLAETR